MALNFPASPSLSDTFTDGTTTWQWDGTAWNIVGNTSAVSIPNNFNTITVAGQDNVVADGNNDSLTLIEGSNITITTDATSDSITISSTGAGGGGGESNQNAFSTVAVSGQNSIIADTTTDTLNIAAGSNITLTTDEGSDTLTISASTSGVSNFSSLGEVTTSGLTFDKIYEPAIVMLRVDNVGTSAYTFNSHYSGNNPTIFALGGTTIAFDLDNISGHPFEIQDPSSSPYNTGLVHVASDGTVSTGASAQGKSSGTLYWRVPESISGNYRYQCQSHAAMVGAITIKRLSLI
jgi:plastocyanin